MVISKQTNRTLTSKYVIEYFSIYDLENIKSAWNKVYEDCREDNPFLCWDWMYKFTQKFGLNENIIIVAAKNDIDYQSFACFKIRNNKLMFFFEKELADYVGAIFRREHSASLLAILSDLNERYRPNVQIYGPIRSTDEISKVMEAYLSSDLGIGRVEEITKNPIVVISGRFSDYYNSLGKKLRQEIRTTENNLKKINTFYLKVARNVDERNEFFTRLVAFHLERQPNKVGGSIFESIDYRNFCHFLLNHSELNFSCEISAVYLGKEIVSVAYCLRCRETLFYWIPSFDSSIKSVSLGKLHIKMLIEYCHKHNIEKFDFMGGTESYKLQWANETYPIYKYLVFKNKYLLQKSAVYFTVREVIKKLVNHYQFLKVLRKILSKVIHVIISRR